MDLVYTVRRRRVELTRDDQYGSCTPRRKVDTPVVPSAFVFVALAFNIFGAGSYLFRLIRGDIRPHIITWTLWALAPYVAFFAQISDGVGVQALLTLSTGTSPLIVVIILLVRRKGSWQVTTFDICCGLLSVTGILAWVITRHAEYAVGFAIGADALASAPTYRKAWRDPHSESWINFGCLAVSALVTLATIKVWAISQYAFASYLGALGLSLAAVIILRGRQVSAGQRR